MIEISNAMLVGYIVIGFIIGLVFTSLWTAEQDMPERMMFLIIILLLWLPAIVFAGCALFFASAIKSADWLKVKLTPYFVKIN